MSVRVIAGAAKGRILKAPKGLATRPTTDRVKESLFAIIGAKLVAATVLDLYSGSGALAIEALSRGAAHAVLVDSAAAAATCIRANIAATQFTECCRLMVLPVQKALAVLTNNGSMFDVVFMDPPYERGHVQKTLAILDQSPLLRPGALIVAEHNRKEEMPEKMANFAMSRQQIYGDTAISIFTVRCEEVQSN